jgi:hypothetical protein
LAGETELDAQTLLDLAADAARLDAERAWFSVDAGFYAVGGWAPERAEGLTAPLSTGFPRSLGLLTPSASTRTR